MIFRKAWFQYEVHQLTILKIGKMARASLVLKITENIALRSLRILYTLYCAWKTLVSFPVRNTKTYKIGRFCRAIFSRIYQIWTPNNVLSAW